MRISHHDYNVFREDHFTIILKEHIIMRNNYQYGICNLEILLVNLTVAYNHDERIDSKELGHKE